METLEGHGLAPNTMLQAADLLAVTPPPPPPLSYHLKSATLQNHNKKKAILIHIIQKAHNEWLNQIQT